MHITMNELTLSSKAEILRAMEICREVESEMFGKGEVKDLCVDGLGHFDKRVMYAKVGTGGSDVLGEWYNVFDKKFKAAKFQPKTRSFVAHLTICKAGKSGVIPDRVLNLSPGILGTQPLTELHFCVKRLPQETTPPVLFTLRR